MITTNEYLREKARADAAEARVRELEAQINSKPQHEGSVNDVPAWDESEDAPE